MNEKRLKVKPYKGQVQRLIAPIMRLLRGENYSSAQHIANMLNPVKVYITHDTYSIHLAWSFTGSTRGKKWNNNVSFCREV